MLNSLELAIAKIRSIGDAHCQNQMYVWPGFNPMDPDPEAFFKKQGIDFDGLLFIRYPVKRTFRPLPAALISDEERSLEVKLPGDYKTLLEMFGEFHLPGKASVCIRAPARALALTRGAWCYEGKPLSALAISNFNNTSDGNSIGYIREGNCFRPELFEFDHELLYEGDNPALWTRKVGDCLADFLLEYLDRNI